MVLPIAFALMGKAASDKMRQDDQDQIDRADSRAWMKEERENTRSEREFQRSERARMLKNRDAVAAAAAPVVPQDGTVFQPTNDDDGNPMPANPTEGSFMVDGKRYANRAAADTAANSPAGASERVSRALMGQGDIHGAQQLRTGLRQEKAADMQVQLHQMQIDEAQRKFANAKFDESLTSLSSFDDLANMVTRMGGSAQGITLQAKKSPDGKKVTLMQVLPDGTLQPTAQTFDNTARGFETAKASFSKSIGPHDKITWLHQQAMEQRQADQLAEQTRHNKATEAIQRYTASAKVAAAHANDTAATADSTFDRKTAAEIAKDTVKKEAEAEAASGKPMSGAAMAKRVDEITGAMFQSHANRFNTSVIARDLQSVRGNPEAYAAAYNKVVSSQTMTPQELRTIGFLPPGAQGGPPQTPAGKAMQAVENVPGGGALQDGKWVPQGQTAPAAAPQQPAPGSVSTAPMPFTEFVAKNITTPDGKAAISRRIAQDLPKLQATIDGDMKVMALPMVSGAVKARLKARIDAASQEAEMMQTFLAGNPGI